MIPAGVSSATFQISTAAVASATSVTISGTLAGVAQSATLNLVAPYSLAGFSINPASQYGMFTAQGTVTMSGPADSAAVVTLTSANPALASVPASVTVPAGATSASFTIVLQPVAANTVVPITASIGGVSQSAVVTILKPADSVQISRAEDVVSKFQLRVDASSTSAAATITVWNTATGTLIGTLANNGGGKYGGTFTTPTVSTITLKSSLGGSVTGAVTLK
jgi:hypothetical protein